ncbi:MAG: hypothetical protein Q9191_000797 [Dirinaria sp. TL-2023a]
MASLAAVSITLLLALAGACYIRQITQISLPKARDTAEERVPRIPYWVPWLGHTFSLLADPGSFVRKTSKHSGHGIFALIIFGYTWNIVDSKCLSKSILDHSEGFFDPTPVLESLLCRAFGADSKLLRRHRITWEDFGAVPVINALGGGENSLPTSFFRNIELSVPKLISFAESLVDQQAWERSSYTTRLDAKVVETDFLPLIRSFVKHITYSALLGREFLDIYPGIFDDLSDFDAGFRYLLLSLPRLFPAQALLRARIARRRMEMAIDSFHKAIDRDAIGEDLNPPWRDLNDVCGLMKDRSSLYRQRGTPPRVKGPLDLYLIWSLGTAISGLVFWLLVRLYDDPTLLDKVRAESAPFARVTQPSGDFSIPEPPRLELDADGLLKSCKLLRACYWECVRLDSSVVSLRKVENDCEVRDTRASTKSDEPPASYTLKAGEYIAIPFALLLPDAACFEPLDLFRPDRFLTPGEDLDSLLCWGDSKSVPLDMRSVEKQVLAFVAGILALWEFNSAAPRAHTESEHQAYPGSMDPQRYVRMRVRRRSFS